MTSGQVGIGSGRSCTSRPYSAAARDAMRDGRVTTPPEAEQVQTLFDESEAAISPDELKKLKAARTKAKKDLKTMAHVDQDARLAGRNIIMILSPLPKAQQKRHFILDHGELIEEDDFEDDEEDLDEEESSAEEEE